MRKPGFTLVEVLTAAVLGVVLVGLTWSAYLTIAKATVASSTELDASQVARVIVDRVSRDVRQTTGFARSLPSTSATGVSLLEFIDGHEPPAGGPYYIRYELISTDIWRKREYYYRPSQPDTRITFNPLEPVYEEGDPSGGQNGQYRHETEAYIIADGVTKLSFYGDTTLVKMDISLQRGGKGAVYQLHSAVAKRN